MLHFKVQMNPIYARFCSKKFTSIISFDPRNNFHFTGEEIKQNLNLPNQGGTGIKTQSNSIRVYFSNNFHFYIYCWY